MGHVVLTAGGGAGISVQAHGNAGEDQALHNGAQYLGVTLTGQRSGLQHVVDTAFH